MNKFDPVKTYSYIKGYAMAKGWENTLNALQFGREAHKGQFRNDGQPYFIHPLIMASHAIALGINDDEITAAILLHDVLEDITGTHAKDLPVNSNIKSAVELLTFNKPTQHKDESDSDYNNRVEQAKSQYYYGISLNKIAIIVKLIDRCHNINSMADSFTVERMKKYIKETDTYIMPLFKVCKGLYPQFSNQIFCIKYHMNGVIDSIRVCLSIKDNK